MYILPYFLENEAKNLLKIKLSKIISNITDEFIDRFGDIPHDTLNLIHIIRIRNTCRKIGITEIGIQGEFIFFVSKYVRNKIK